jgi:hypothetical protein
MPGISAILSTLQGKIVAGVVAASLAGASGLLVVKTVSDSMEVSAKADGSGAGKSGVRANSEYSSSEGALGTSATGAAGIPKSGLGGADSTTTMGAGIGTSALGIRSAVPGLNTSGRGASLSGAGANTSGPGGSSSVTVNPTLPDPPGLGTPVPAPPTGTSPLGVSTYAHGSYSVIIPATPGGSREVCLEGSRINRKCRTVEVPETSSVKLTISFTGNASVTAPEFTVGSCDGGYSIRVGGLTPGATVTATANAKTPLSETVNSKDEYLTASICKP